MLMAHESKFEECRECPFALLHQSVTKDGVPNARPDPGGPNKERNGLIVTSGVMRKQIAGLHTLRDAPRPLERAVPTSRTEGQQLLPSMSSNVAVSFPSPNGAKERHEK